MRASYHRAVDVAPDEALGLLRPALQLALDVAREGAMSTPAVSAPRMLGPILQHAKLSSRALATVRDALESDAQFRERVVAVASEQALGRVPFAWLTRRSGWQEELRAGLDAEATAADVVADERAERQARRRLEAVQRRRMEAEAEAARNQEAVSAAEAQLSEARQQRRAAEEEAGTLRASLSELSGRVEQLETDAKASAAAKGEMEELLEGARARIGTVTAERDEALARAERADAAAAKARSTLADQTRDAERTRVGLVQAVSDATHAARALGAALASATAILRDGAGSGGAAPAGATASALAPGETVPAGETVPVVETAPAGEGAPGVPAISQRRTIRRRPGRRPVRLPPAIFDDSTDAAAFLVTVPGMVLAVDGYNVTMSGWPGAELARQRQVLLDRLAALAARTGAEVRVFFDGAEDHQFPPPRGQARDSVRVSFSTAGTDADEDIIAFVGGLPTDRAVTVATSDRRVALEVDRRGANVISSAQLLGVLGREPGMSHPPGRLSP